jgi:hypothetical protein
MPPVLVALIRALVRAGLRVELRAVLFDSYAAVVRNELEQRVGDIEYRSPLDEPAEYARGLSYASVYDPQHFADHAFRVAQRVLRENSRQPRL